MKMRITTLALVATTLGGCSFFENYNYDDYSLYHYDVSNNYGTGVFQSHDYQDDYYGGGTFQNHMRYRQAFEHEVR